MYFSETKPLIRRGHRADALRLCFSHVNLYAKSMVPCGAAHIDYSSLK